MVDPRRIPIVNFAHQWLRPNLGTDVAWINGLMHVIIKEQLYNKDFVENRTTGFDALKQTIETYTPDYVEAITGIPAAEIISAAREIQSPLGVAFLGPEATFSHLAALKKFGYASRFGPMATIQEVFGEVAKGKFHYGVVPIENSTEGVVNDTLDLFAETPLRICGEIYLEISHDLVSKSGQKFDIEVIYTHPQAHGQCRRWLATHLPEIPVLEVASTGVAAQKASKNPNSAAIASAFAAPLYDLRLVEAKIEDHPGNITHFFVIGPDAPGSTGCDKTSIIFAVDDIPGALYKTLRPLADRSLNMTRIVSRPVKTEAWRYLFYVDLDGHREEPEVNAALEEIETISAHFKLLGSFPK